MCIRKFSWTHVKYTINAHLDACASESSLFAMQLLTSQALLLLILYTYMCVTINVYVSTPIHMYECMHTLLNATVYCIYEQRNVALLDAFECIACTCDAYYIDKLCLFAWLILYGCACERMQMHYRTALCLRALDARVYAQRLQVCEQETDIQTRYVYYLVRYVNGGITIIPFSPWQEY